MSSHVVDLRSDTVTKPNQAMRQAMADAEVGDDVYGEDPTIIALQERCAKLLGKEKSLFTPSGTMANLIACMTHCQERGSELICGDKCHIALYEQGNVAQLAGVFPRILPNLPDGTIDLDQLKATINPGADPHACKTKLICLENTHNRCGGKIIPLEYLENVYNLAQENNIKVHFDGARLFNASVALGVAPSEIAKYCDSLSLCLSKGVGAPVGSVIAGTSDFIKRAHRCRKALGGGMRQAGVIAAACMVGLDDITDKFQKNHRHAKKIVDAIEGVFPEIVQIKSEDVATNIIIMKIVKEGMKPSDLIERLKQVSPKEKEILKKETLIKCGMMGSENVRFVTNWNVSDEDIELVIQKLSFVLKEMSIA